MAVTWVGQLTHPSCQQTPEEIKLREFVDAAQRGDERAANKLEAELNAPKPPPSMGSAALWYASIGWRVFPLRVGDKRPATRNGFKDATRDERQIREWWGQAEYNIGLPTGADSGFDVIDIDGPTGFESASTVDMPETHGKVSTPRGAHLYILPTGLGNRAGAMPGIDMRSDGGYVVAPPSRVGDKSYSWTIKPSPKIMRAT